jgi:hypothetical protein
LKLTEDSAAMTGAIANCPTSATINPAHSEIDFDVLTPLLFLLPSNIKTFL